MYYAEKTLENKHLQLPEPKSPQSWFVFSPRFSQYVAHNKRWFRGNEKKKPQGQKRDIASGKNAKTAKQFSLPPRKNKQKIQPISAGFVIMESKTKENAREGTHAPKSRPQCEGCVSFFFFSQVRAVPSISGVLGQISFLLHHISKGHVL